MPERNKVSRSLQTSSNELSLNDSQTADFAELASNPQTESKINTLTTTSNLHRVTFDNISISTIKTSIDIKNISKNIQIIIHIKYTYRLPKGGICVEVKTEEQKQLLISKANIIFLINQHYNPLQTLVQPLLLFLKTLPSPVFDLINTCHKAIITTSHNIRPIINNKKYKTTGANWNAWKTELIKKISQ